MNWLEILTYSVEIIIWWLWIEQPPAENNVCVILAFGPATRPICILHEGSLIGFTQVTLILRSFPGESDSEVGAAGHIWSWFFMEIFSCSHFRAFTIYQYVQISQNFTLTGCRFLGLFHIPHSFENGKSTPYMQCSHFGNCPLETTFHTCVLV